MYLCTLVMYVAVVMGLLGVTVFSLEDDKVDQTEFTFLYEMRVPKNISSSKHESILLTKAEI